eukprot:5051845-Pyramimonas_sp.AAC.1
MGRVFKNEEERYYAVCKQLFTPAPGSIDLPYGRALAAEKVAYTDESFTIPTGLVELLKVIITHMPRWVAIACIISVSYTHLTLPTILLV